MSTQSNNKNTQSTDSAIELNIPSVNFSLPQSDDIKPIDSKIESKKADVGYLSVEDLNKLFLSDDWKEPDWSTFDPYRMDSIEPPLKDDFLNQKSDLPTFNESSEQKSVKRTTSRPLELYIRGNSYVSVFTELEKMNDLLKKQESKLAPYTEVIKKEETLAHTSKEDMEFVYRKLNQIDRKIFSAL